MRSFNALARISNGAASDQRLVLVRTAPRLFNTIGSPARNSLARDHALSASLYRSRRYSAHARQMNFAGSLGALSAADRIPELASEERSCASAVSAWEYVSL